MNLATVISDSWIWFAAAGLVAVLWWLARGARRAPIGATASHGHGGSHSTAPDGRIDFSANSPEQPAVAAQRGAGLGSRQTGSGRRHGCC